jgi:hypothetical protein
LRETNPLRLISVVYRGRYFKGHFNYLQQADILDFSRKVSSGGGVLDKEEVG